MRGAGPSNKNKRSKAAESDAPLELRLHMAAALEAVKLVRRNDRVRRALGMITDGEELGRYFGIIGPQARQSEQEAGLAALLLDRLQTASDPEELDQIIAQLRALARRSGADVQALRALRRRRLQ